MAGIPPGSLEAVLSILRETSSPIRRRKLLAELEARGHRISLAGLNRILDHCHRTGATLDTPEGVLLRPSPARPRP